MTNIINNVETTCHICSQHLPENLMHRHPFFNDLCKPCVKTIRNKIKSQNGRARKLSKRLGTHVYGFVSPRDWVGILREHNFSCAYCSRTSNENPNNGPIIKLSLDHKYPLACGGLHLAYNIQPLCLECHSVKDNSPTLHPWKIEKNFLNRKQKRLKNRKIKMAMKFFRSLGIKFDSAFFLRAEVYSSESPNDWYETIVEFALIEWLNSKIKNQNRI